ncbi:MAG: hypothetical protein ABI551_04815 [Polyangiaceae bacterium]
MASTRYFTIHERPVVIATRDDGSTDALVLEDETGTFVRDRRYVARVSEPGTDVQEHSAEELDAIVATLRVVIVGKLLVRAIAWQNTGFAGFPHTATVGHVTLTVRVNDEPDEPVYTLMAKDDELADMDDWPAAWTKGPESMA